MDRRRVTELHCITPIANVASIMEIGILSHERAARVGHVSIADEDVQDLRRGKRVPGGRMLHEYANTYFDARNPMMSRVRDKRREIVVLRVSPAVLDLPGAVIADGNAAAASRFYSSPAGLAHLDEERVYSLDWRDSDPWEYREKKRQRCAEVLIPDVIPAEFVFGCFAHHRGSLRSCQDAAPELAVEVKPDVYF